VDTGLELAKATSLGAGGGDRQAVPLVRVDAQYPPRAKQLRIEGWVEVAFGVTKVGTVKDATVIGSKPSLIFDRAAIDAVRRWRYNPKIENGSAVEQPGQMFRFEFNLPKGGR
jgi:protein TonB